MNLNEAKFANFYGYSDVKAYEIVKVVSEKTIEIRRMNAVKDPNWKPEFVVGGFAGHCTNQNEQKWIYSQNTEAKVIRARLNKKGQWKSVYGRHVLSDKPREFYDYNF